SITTVIGTLVLATLTTSSKFCEVADPPLAGRLAVTVSEASSCPPTAASSGSDEMLVLPVPPLAAVAWSLPLPLQSELLPLPLESLPFAFELAAALAGLAALLAPLLPAQGDPLTVQLHEPSSVTWYAPEPLREMLSPETTTSSPDPVRVADPLKPEYWTLLPASTDLLPLPLTWT